MIAFQVHSSLIKFNQVYFRNNFSSSTDSEGLEVDVETLGKLAIKPKRKYRKRRNLSIAQRKNYKKDKPAAAIPTVEFKSSRAVCYDKREKAKKSAQHSFNFKVAAESVE